jgi:hypothetical protein
VKTPMVALGIFIFLGQLNNFFYPLIFLNSDNLFTLPRWVNQFKGAYSYDWGGLMAATSLAAVPFLIIFIIAQKQIVEGIALSLSLCHTSGAVGTGRWHPAALHPQAQRALLLYLPGPGAAEFLSPGERDAAGTGAP